MGILAVISRLAILGFWEEVLDVFFTEKIPQGPSTFEDSDPLKSTYHMADKGKNPAEASSKGESLSNSNTEQDIFAVAAADLKEDTQFLNKAILAWAQQLKSYGDLPFDQISIKNSEGNEPLLTLLRKQSNIYTGYVKNRMTWVETGKVFTYPENKENLRDIHFKLVAIQENYLSKVKKISQSDNELTQVRVFYATLNEYRNACTKELNKADNLILKDIREGVLGDNVQLKKVINGEYTQAKKEFNNRDGYLKAKVGEIINARNK